MHSMSQYYPDTKTSQNITRKENDRPASLMNMGTRSPQQNTSKPNPATHKKNHTP